MALFGLLAAAAFGSFMPFAWASRQEVVGAYSSYRAHAAPSPFSACVTIKHTLRLALDSSRSSPRSTASRTPFPILSFLSVRRNRGRLSPYASLRSFTCALGVSPTYHSHDHHTHDHVHHHQQDKLTIIRIIRTTHSLVNHSHSHGDHAYHHDSQPSHDPTIIHITRTSFAPAGDRLALAARAMTWRRCSLLGVSSGLLSVPVGVVLLRAAHLAQRVGYGLIPSSPLALGLAAT